MREDSDVKDEQISEEVKELVIARIEAQASSNLRLSIGGGKGLTKNEMVEHVKRGDGIGKTIVNTHLAFIKAIAKGEVAGALASV